ncbi:unnamed protein product [Alopecurus aequalis]
MESYSPKQALLLLIALASAMILVTAQNTAQDMVDAHNAARADVGVAPVTWDDTVAAYADAYAQERRVDCQLVHSPDSPYGENLFWGSGSEWTGIDAVKAWVSEKQYYDHDTNTCSAPDGESCGHYTQVVWSNSTTIGCAGLLCDGATGVFIICSYNPPGNWDGQTPY